jgi:uncharacterized protein YxeA
MFDNPVVMLFVLLACMAGLLWYARIYDRIHKRVKEQQDRADEQQKKAEEVQERAARLIEREDAVVARAEKLLDRIESKLLS